AGRRRQRVTVKCDSEAGLNHDGQSSNATFEDTLARFSFWRRAWSQRRSNTECTKDTKEEYLSSLRVLSVRCVDSTPLHGIGNRYRLKPASASVPCPSA